MSYKNGAKVRDQAYYDCHLREAVRDGFYTVGHVMDIITHVKNGDPSAAMIAWLNRRKAIIKGKAK